MLPFCCYSAAITSVTAWSLSAAILQNCYTGLAELYPSPADWQAIRSRLVADLLLAAGEARGVKPHELDPSQPWWAALKQEQPVLPRSILSDAGFLKWQVLLIQVTT